MRVPVNDIAAVLARGIAYFCWWVAGIGTMLTLIAVALLIADRESFNEGIDATELVLFWALAGGVLVAAGWALRRLANHWDPPE